MQKLRLLPSLMLLVAGLAGCRSAKSPETLHPPELDRQPTVNGSASPSAESPPSLHNFTLQTVLFQEQSWPWISFQVGPGVEFVEWQACRVGGGEPSCKGGSIHSSSHVLVDLPQGVLTIKVRSCRWLRNEEAERSLCSLWQERPYVQPAPIRERLNKLLDERSLKAQSIRNLGLTVFDALKVYKEAVQACPDEEVTKIIPSHVGETLLAWGPASIGIGLLDPEASLLVQSDERTELSSNLGQLADEARLDEKGEDKKGKGDGDESVAKLSFVAGALAVVTPPLLKGGAKQLSKTTRQVGGGLLPTPSSEEWQTNPQGARAKALGRTLMIGFGVTALMGLVVYAALNKQSSLKDATQEYLKDVFSLSGDSCAPARAAADAIVAANAKASRLRNEMHTIGLEIDLEVERGRKAFQP